MKSRDSLNIFREKNPGTVVLSGKRNSGLRYWKTLISAVVETAAPTHVVLTFPSGKPSLVASDFSIAGFTIGSASWNGAVLTLVLTSAVTYYDFNLIVTFVKTGQFHAITNNVGIDDNTVGLYTPSVTGGSVKDGNGVESIYWDMRYGSSARGTEQVTGNIVKYAVYEITATQADYFYTGCQVGDVFACGTVKACNASNKVKRVTGNHLTQPVVASRPTNRILDGVDDFMKTAPFTWNQPETIYMVLRQITSTQNDAIFDGNAGDSGTVQQNDSAGSLTANAGSKSTRNPNQTLNTWAVLVSRFNGVNSFLKINKNTTVITGNFGAANMGGFTLGSYGTYGALYGNFEVKDIVLRNSADDEATTTKIINWLQNRNSIVESPYVFDKGKVVITFDDSHDNLVTNGLPILVSKGVKATFYILGNELNQANCLSDSQLQSLYEAGMDVQNHTWNHVDIAPLTPAAITNEIEMVNAKFATLNIPRTTQLAGPGGSLPGVGNLSTIQGLVQSCRGIGQQVGDRLLYFVDKLHNKYKLSTLPAIDNMDATLFNSTKNHINNAELYRYCAIIYCHGVTVSGGTYSVSEAMLSDLIDYIKTKQVDIITTSELIQLMG